MGNTQNSSIQEIFGKKTHHSHQGYQTNSKNSNLYQQDFSPEKILRWKDFLQMIPFAKMFRVGESKISTGIEKGSQEVMFVSQTVPKLLFTFTPVPTHLSRRCHRQRFRADALLGARNRSKSSQGCGLRESGPAWCAVMITGLVLREWRIYL